MMAGSQPTRQGRGVDVTAVQPSIVEEKPAGEKGAAPTRPTRILVIDIGGSKVKMLVTGQHEPVKVPSGKKLTPAKLVEAIKELAKEQDWEYDAISVGYPGLVGPQGPRSEPGNLGHGWVGFNFALAFGRPVRVINDAAMQALGSYDGGRMLFLGLGTGLGSALIADHAIIPLELGSLRHKEGSTLGEVLGKKGLEKLGKEVWIEVVKEVIASFSAAFIVDYIVLGGGNAKKLKGIITNTRLGHNLTAFRGGQRLWKIEDVPTLSADGEHRTPRPNEEWRVL
jgi:polyphosphate glucokinase